MLSEFAGSLRSVRSRPLLGWTLATFGAAYGAWYFAVQGKWTIALLVLCAPALAALAFTRPILVPYALFVLIVPIDSLFTIGESGTIARFLGLVSGACILFYNMRRGQFIVPHRALLAIVGFVAYAALSVVWSLDPQNGIKTTLTFVQLAALYAILATAPLEKRDLRVILGAIVLSGTLAAIYGIWTFHGQTIANDEIYARLDLAIGNNNMDINMYADSLLLPIALCLWMWARGRGLVRWLVLSPALCTMFWAILVTGSRESLLGIGVMLIYVALLSGYRRRVIPLLVAGAVLTAFVPSVRFRFSQALGSDGAGRLDIWHVGWHAFLAHPWFGSGLGSFAASYDRYFLDVYQPYDAGWMRASHDLLVHYGVEGGIAALLLVAAVWAAQFLQARQVSQFPELRELGVALGGALAALLVVSLFIDTFEAKSLWLAFALVAQARACGIWAARPVPVTLTRTRVWEKPAPGEAVRPRRGRVALPS